jgi:hypothetical protein
VVGGKIKARVDLGKNGAEKDMEMGSGEDGGQEDAHGVIIHDDD